MFFGKFKLYLFSQKRNFCLVICRKEGNKLCRLSGRMLLLASIPPPHIYSCFPHTLVSSPAPSLSLSLTLARLIRWHVCKMARCVSGIHFHVCQKSNESSSKTFRAGQGLCPLPPASCLCLPACPTHLIRSSLWVHLYILSVWHSPSQIYGKLLANEHRKRHFVFSKI